MVVEVSLKHIPMRAQVCFDTATEGVTGRLVWPTRRCPTHAVSHSHLKKVVVNHERSVAKADDFFSSDSIVGEIWSSMNACQGDYRRLHRQ